VAKRRAATHAVRKLKLVTRGVAVVLILIAIVALMEKGPPPLYVFSGASPANPGSLGTYTLLLSIRDRYPETTAVFILNDLRFPAGTDRCLYIVISPEKPYTADEARHIANALRTCRRPAVLVADEATTSNSILEALGVSARVVGRVVLDSVTGLPYPNATFTISGREFRVALDIASAVEGGSSIVGIVDKGLLYGSAGPPAPIPVAVEESRGNLTVMVIGDGSLFLNQVMESPQGAVYKELAMAIVDRLCGGDPRCYVVFDGSHYTGVPAQKMLSEMGRVLASITPFDVLWLIPMLIAEVLHPATWMPLLVDALNRGTKELMGMPSGPTILMLLSLAAGYYVVRKLYPRVPDSKLPEQVEREEFATGDVRSAILSGRYRLTKQDFARLYEIVDSVLRSVEGYGLADPRARGLISKLLGRERGARYAESMVRLYERAVGKRRFLPIVLSWHRTTLRMLRESEELLRALGSSLEAEKGVEYVLMR